MAISDRVGPWRQGAHQYRNNVLYVDVFNYVRRSERVTIQRAGGPGGAPSARPRRDLDAARQPSRPLR